MKKLKINGQVVEATDFATDGCHKVYLIADEDDLETMLGNGYTEPGDIRPISELPEFWEKSCSLRMISAADLETQYVEQCVDASVRYEEVGIELFTATRVDSIEAAASRDIRKNPDYDQQIANDNRATEAAVAILAYRMLAGDAGEGESISDLLANLMHLCDALVDEDDEPVNFEELIGSARRRYEEEIRGEE